MLLLLFAVAVCAVNAQVPCQVPAELSFHAERQNFGERYFQRFYTEYDRNNLRVVMFEESVYNGSRDAHEYLFLHRVDTAFDYDFRSKSCRRFPAGPFRPIGVPNNATFDGTFTLGGPNEGFVVQRWSDRIPRRQRETWTIDVTQINCDLVNQFVLDQDNFNNTFITNFYNVVGGIVNPNDFDVPRECFNATYVSEIPREARMARSVYTRTMLP